MLQETSFFLTLDYTAQKVRVARAERIQLLAIANNAWHEYQKFVDEDPRWQNPNCSETHLEEFRKRLSLLRINAELADQAAKVAYQKIGILEAKLFQILGSVA